MSKLQKRYVGALRARGLEVHILEIAPNYAHVLIINPNDYTGMRRVFINPTGALIGEFRYRLDNQPAEAAA